MFSALFLLLSLRCVFTSSAEAQFNNGCWAQIVSAATGLFGEPYEPPIPATAVNCQGLPFEFAQMCWVLNNACPPADAAPETCASCSKTPPVQGGGPIFFATGDTYIEENDIRLPGLGGGLVLTRMWNSLWPATQSAYQIGLFGPNWRSTFEERVFAGGDGYMKYARGDGSFWSLGFSRYNPQSGDDEYTVVAPANMSATLSQGSTSWTLTFQNGEQRLFDNTTGHLTAIIDRNGNTTQLSYDSLGRLTTVADPASRHLYFNYGSGSYLVASVTSDFGPSVSYSYDGQGRLTQVTEPDGSTLSFQYDSNSFISAVLDSNGKILEAHTYDNSGRGLTSTRANGVEALTVTYIAE